jgi:hypothetical protein
VEHFVTLFNSLFLPQGLALHLSMERHLRDYKLWILCVDDETNELLGRLDLPNISRLKLSDLETPELLEVKQGRTVAEYCWTLTPFAPKFVFEADSTVERVTYIDSDLWFRKNPKPIFDEFEASDKQVLITDHAYAPEYDQSETSGQFCVQYMTFSRNGGEFVRQWWEDRCIEWCFARVEDGKFGDQKYLDAWPEQFGDVVHVLRDKELTLAPWNATRFPYGNAIFYHFHGLRIISKNKIEIQNYFLPKVLINHVYNSYFDDIREIISQLEFHGYKFVPQAKAVSVVRRFYRKLLVIKEKVRPIFTGNQQRF